MLRFDIADGTYREATASGQLEVIRDLDLRAAVTQYYFDARRFGPTIDDRVEITVERFTAVLAEKGLSPAGRAADEDVLRLIRADPRIVAELKNVRYWAAFQADRHDLIVSLASALEAQLDGSNK